MTNPELNDIQGLILRTYGTKKSACYTWLTVTDPLKAKAWLRDVMPFVTSAEDKGKPFYLNFAFSYQGLREMDLDDETLETFSPEFKTGALDNHRLRMLGDVHKNDPENWHWGNAESAGACHIMMLLYADNDTALEEAYRSLTSNPEEKGIVVFKRFDTKLLPDNKEHFGFRDGISQPSVEGFGREDHPANQVKPGEFIFGYPNEYGKFPESPYISPQKDSANLLPDSPLVPGKKDLGKNGSYLVFRQISQDVKGFWDFMKEAALQNPHSSASDYKFLAAKAIGRWPGGAPVTLSPAADDLAMATRNDFGYHEQDKGGLRCPLGSHVRRTNPRDAFVEDPAKSTVFVKKHRLLRRSRPYGEPLDASMEIDRFVEKKDVKDERGIFFLCFNASISRQFEFIQQSWVVNPQFRDLYQDPDPFTGNQDMEKDGIPAYFTMPGEPVRERVCGVKSFVHIKGSAYLFMPGMKGLRFICGG